MSWNSTLRILDVGAKRIIWYKGQLDHFCLQFGCWMLQLQNAHKYLQTEKAGNRSHGRALSPSPSHYRQKIELLLLSPQITPIRFMFPRKFSVGPTFSQSFWLPSQWFSTCRYPRAKAKLGRSYICHLPSPPPKFHKGPQVSSIPQEKSCGSAGPRLLVQSPEVLSGSCPSPSSLISHLFGNLQI